MARSAKDSTAADPVALGEPRTAAPRGTGWLFAGLFLLYMFDYIDREVVSSRSEERRVGKEC
jgi:hypothetical protein